MKKSLVLKYTSDSQQLEETCDPADLVDPASDPRSRRTPGRVQVKTQDEADEWGRAIIERYNRSRFEAEAERTFISAELKEAEPMPSSELTPERRKQVEKWMRDQLRFHPADYDDCGEVNCTKLAESCADELDLYADDQGTIHEELFEWAVSIAQGLEEQEEEGDDDTEDYTGIPSTAAEAWRRYVGDQTPEDFLANAGVHAEPYDAIRAHVETSELCEGLDEYGQDEITDMLFDHLAKTVGL